MPFGFIPDSAFGFAGIPRLARRSKRSRSQLSGDAVREYVARHASDEITDALDRVCAEIGSHPDGLAATAASRILKNSEW
jgi:predicted transcriptional regulator